MKIALVCPYNYHLPGGVQSHIRDLYKVLGERGHNIKIITPKIEAAKITEDNLIYLGNSQRIKFQGTQIDISLAVGKEYEYLQAILIEENFDIIHYHTIWNPFIPLQILLNSESANVVTFHDTPRQSLFGKLASNVLLPIVSYSLLKFYIDAAIAVSEAPATYLKKTCSNKVYIIPNGVFVDRFSPKNQQPLTQYIDGQVNILFLGRLEARKGIFYLLEAYANLKQKYPQIRLLIAGDGYQKAAVNKFIVEYDLKDVIMLGFISEADKSRYYATCDIYCSPAFDGESFGIVLVEAMASGKPAVGAANLGYQTVLTDQGQNLLVKPQNVEDIVTKLSELIENRFFREEMAAWGLAAAKQYDWQHITTKIEQVYQDAILRKVQRLTF